MDVHRIAPFDISIRSRVRLRQIGWKSLREGFILTLWCANGNVETVTSDRVCHGLLCHTPQHLTRIFQDQLDTFRLADLGISIFVSFLPLLFLPLTVLQLFFCPMGSQASSPILRASHAGSWYPRAQGLQSTLSSSFSRATVDVNSPGVVRAIIVPHAGYKLLHPKQSIHLFTTASSSLAHCILSFFRIPQSRMEKPTTHHLGQFHSTQLPVSPWYPNTRIRRRALDWNATSNSEVYFLWNATSFQSLLVKLTRRNPKVSQPL
jgi:hypothetical protein